MPNMSNECGIVNCKGNYTEENNVECLACQETNLRDRNSKMSCLHGKTLLWTLKKCSFVKKHWRSDLPMIKLPGGSTQPAIPPCLFNVQHQCTKNSPSLAKGEDQQFEIYFLQKDNISSLDTSSLDKGFQKKYGKRMLCCSRHP
ncbi:hypothetical protein PoB_007651000 [Plakobranchus ocellatus]|uniref:Uncharacterized protein n=1 Tax=Plakobranchus ocellatus TaxID=259542 RepID=A0AAV4E0T0_9GAST|nr:hypothetical protein PoB_007651000 [Plakobranchus ocellatus]